MDTSISKDRETRAALAIKQSLGTELGEDNVNLFVEHHMAELPQSYWKQHLASGTPDPLTVTGLLVLRSSWGENDIEYFDFALPGEVTDYVISVHFDEAGSIDGISMES